MAINTSGNEDFSSRFFNDYKYIKPLGKGGFGYVFEATNKVDEQKYAIKRIKLEKKGKKKAMREVKILAQLNHTNIVRYFQAWDESPPIEWQEEKDRQLFEGESSFSPDDPDDWSNVSMKESENSQTSDSFQIVFCENVSPNNSVLSDNQQSSIDKFEHPEDNNTTEIKKNRKELSTEENYRKSKEVDPNKKEEQLVIGKRSPINQSSYYLYIQMELCKEGSLRDWLDKNIPKRDMCKSIEYFNQILNAVVFIHDEHLIHRDLKPSNILFSMDDRIKLADFGLVQGPFESEFDFDSADNNHGPSLTKDVGTKLYMSPEQVEGKKYNNKVDVFALGLIFVDLLVEFKTCSERITVLEEVKTGNYSKIKKIGKELTLIKEMMNKDPEQRLSSKDVQSKLKSHISLKHVKSLNQESNTNTSPFHQILPLKPIIYETEWNVCIPLIIYPLKPKYLEVIENSPKKIDGGYLEISYNKGAPVGCEKRLMRMVPALTLLEEEAVAILKLYLYHTVSINVERGSIDIKRSHFRISKKEFTKNMRNKITPLRPPRLWFIHFEFTINKSGFSKVMDWNFFLQYSLETGKCFLEKTSPKIENKDNISILKVTLPYGITHIEKPNQELWLTYTGAVQPMAEFIIANPGLGYKETLKKTGEALKLPKRTTVGMKAMK